MEVSARRVKVLAVAAAVIILGLVGALAWSCSTRPGPGTGQPPQAGQQPGTQQLTIWLTGYSWQDNTPPGSSKVGEPVVHQEAGGTGTFADPITVAVPGHKGSMPWQPGTKFYLPTMQRYVIVEDSGAAKEPAGTDTHLDMWVEGQDGTKAATDKCEADFTGKVPAQVNPPDNLPVMAGPVFAKGKCNIPPQPDNRGTYKDQGGDSGSKHDGGDDGDDDHGGKHGGGHHRHHGRHHGDSDHGDDDEGDGN